jgi:long-subunit fatty acid transport protein
MNETSSPHESSLITRYSIYRHSPHWLVWLSVLGFFCLGLSTHLHAQPLERLEISSSPNPVGSGARALGMGGAFIAVADDATAASWNPGGLIQLERPEMSMVGAGFYRIEDNTFGRNPGASGEQTASKASLNYLSGAYPFSLFNTNMIVSLNYQHLYDFTRDWRFHFRDRSLNANVDYEQAGGLYAYGLAYCVQLLDQLSFGFTLNLWEDGLYRNGWEQTIITSGTFNTGGGKSVKGTIQSQQHERFSFNGFNANLGLLWAVNGNLSIGAVFKTPFTADLEHEVSSTNTVTIHGQTDTSRERRFSNEDLNMPMSYGLGIAYRFSDKLTVAADVYRTHWQDFILEDSKGKKTSPVSGRPSDESDVDATTQIRLGAEYLFILPKYVIPLRGGVFYDPAPAEGGPDHFFGFTLGSGIGIGRFVFDVAYQARFGRDVGGSILANQDFSQDVDEHTVYTSLIVHF